MQTPQHIGTMQTLTNLASNVRTLLRDLRAELTSNVRTLLRDLRAELTRLNRAGVAAHELKGRSRRERTRLVKAAVAARHYGQTRCC